MPLPLPELQKDVDTHGRRILNAFSGDVSVRSFTNAINPDGSSGSVTFQGVWNDGTQDVTLTVSVIVTP